jgi:hypothetical protein
MQQNNNFDSEQPMNKLVEAKFKGKYGVTVMFRVDENTTRIYTSGHVTEDFPAPLESVVRVAQKRFELLELKHQIKKREPGNSDKAYRTTKFSGRKWVGLA